MEKICENCKWAQDSIEDKNMIECYYYPTVIPKEFYNFCSKFEAKDRISGIPTNHENCLQKFNYLSQEEENFLCQIINDLNYSYSILDENSKKLIMVELDDNYGKMIRKLILFAKLQRFSDLNDGNKIELFTISQPKYYIYFTPDFEKINIAEKDLATDIPLTILFVSKEVAEEALRIYSDEIKEIFRGDK